MKFSITWANTLDWFMALLTALLLIAVLQTFIIGKHYIIPTAILCLTVLIGNLAWYGLKNAAWAKRINFWCGFLLTNHAFFALFWSKKYRELLGGAFEPVCVVVTLVLAIVTFLYFKHNFSAKTQAQ